MRHVLTVMVTTQIGYQIIDQAYVANTRTDGTDYQGKYGGAFLDEH